jgi:hypothetical protein
VDGSGTAPTIVAKFPLALRAVFGNKNPGLAFSSEFPTKEKEGAKVPV